MRFNPYFHLSEATAEALATIDRIHNGFVQMSLSDCQVTDVRRQIDQRVKDHNKQRPDKLHLVDPHLGEEIQWHRTAQEKICTYLNGRRTITEDYIHELNGFMCSGCHGWATPYRRHQNDVRNKETGELNYTPPPPGSVPDYMHQLTTWLNQPKEMHVVIESAIAYYQFVHIHPFGDGNRRTAQLLSTFCLYRDGYVFRRLFLICHRFDRDLGPYYQALQDVQGPDWDMTPWLDCFAQSLASQLAFVQQKAESPSSA